jgi:hypothetical protein
MKALVLWHYFDGNGKIQNHSSTSFEGPLHDLQEMIRESAGENEKADGSIISVVHQIVILES